MAAAIFLASLAPTVATGIELCGEALSQADLHACCLTHESTGVASSHDHHSSNARIQHEVAPSSRTAKEPHISPESAMDNCVCVPASAHPPEKNHDEVIIEGNGPRFPTFQVVSVFSLVDSPSGRWAASVQHANELRQTKPHPRLYILHELLLI